MPISCFWSIDIIPKKKQRDNKHKVFLSSIFADHSFAMGFIKDRLFLLSLFFLIGAPLSNAQKLLQLEKVGKFKITKIYLGETIFVKTVQNPDTWYEAVIEDVSIEANAIIFPKRIIPLDDIVAMKRRKKSGAHAYGRSLQYSAIAPVVYEGIYGLVNPPIEWESLAYISGGALVLGSLLRLLPPKQYKMGKKYRLRVLDLTFYKPPVP